MANKAGNSDSLLSTQDLMQVLRIIKKNWWVLILFPLLFGAAGYIYAYQLPDIHGARNKVLVKEEKTYDYQRGIRQKVGYYGKYQKIQNQKRVVRSRDLIQKAVEKMDVDVSYYVIGRIRTQEFYKGMPFEVRIDPKHGWLYEKKIYLDVVDRNRYRINYGHEGKRFSHTFRFGDSVSTEHFNMKVLAGPGIRNGSAEEVLSSNYYFVRHRKNYLVSRYLSRLNVKNIEYTSILRLSVKDPVPERAVTFLDTLSKVYIQHTLEQRKEVNKNTLRYIERQLDKVSKILTGIEDTLEEYKSRRGILNLSKEKSEYFRRLVEFDSKRRKLKLRLESYRSLENYVEKLNTQKERLLPSSFYITGSDDFLKKALGKLYSLQTRRNELLYQSKEKSPKIKRVENEIAEMKGNLLTYIDNSKEAVKDRIEDVQDQIGQYEGIISGIPEKERGLLNIRRRQKVNENLYKYLLEKRANTIIARAGIVPQTKVIESARSVGVVKPSEDRYMYMGAGAGLVLSLLFTLVRTFFFYRITSLSELKELTSLPVLGQLFRHKTAMKENQLLLLEGGKGVHLESLRTVRANLQFFLKKGQGNVIQVNSVGPGEGKSFVSANLAHILAKAEKKVLLLEFDLHKPRLHRVFGFETKGEGLSAYLSENADLEGCINPSGFDHLDVALCGEIPPNASELLLKERVDELLDHARKHYDQVIVDTPPAGVLSDSVVLMPKSDLNLFLINAQRSKVQEVRFIEGLVQKHELGSVGMLLNGVKRQNFRYYYDRYSYKYGYGYGGGYYGYGS